MSERTYKDSDGNPVRLAKLCKDEPEWAANQILHRDKLERELAEAREMLASARADAESWSQQSDMHATDALVYAKDLDEARAEVARLREMLKGMEEKQARTHAMLRTAAVAHTRLREALSQADNWLQAWLKRHPCNHSAFLICEICEAREALAAKGKNDL